MNRTERNTSEKITKNTKELATTICTITLLSVVVLSQLGQIPLQQQAAAQTQKPRQQIVQRSANMTTAKMPNTAGTMDTTTMGSMMNMMNAMNTMMQGMHTMMNAMNMPMTSNNTTTSMSMGNSMQ